MKSTFHIFSIINEETLKETNRNLLD